MRKPVIQACFALASVCHVPALGLAADATPTTDEKLRDLGLAGSNVGAPGYGRVLVAFLLVAALAWGASWLLRRYGFKFRSISLAGTAPIRLLARDTLPGGVACHLVEAQGKRVLITVSRTGVSSLLLGEVPAPSDSPPPAGGAVP